MELSYEPFLERIRGATQRDGMADMCLAREEFHRLTGEFDEGEPWFELRMTMFHDWYLLDRMGQDGRTPAESFLLLDGEALSEGERRQYHHLTVTLRSAFRILRLTRDRILLDDIVLGGRWLATWTLPTVGLQKDDIIDARLVLVGDILAMGRGAVLHPREAKEPIETIVARANASRMPPRAVVDHLDKMRLKLDRYSNVKIRHVYQYPDDAVL